MMKNYEKLLSGFEAPEPPAGLKEKILLSIERREKRSLGLKIAASAVVFAGSTWTIFEGVMSLSASLSRSGFLQFGSLLFSDFSSTIANFPDFIFSIAESFPVFSAAVVLGGVVFAVWSMAFLLDEAMRMHKHTFLIAK